MGLRVVGCKGWGGGGCPLRPLMCEGLPGVDGGGVMSVSVFVNVHGRCGISIKKKPLIYQAKPFL